MQTLDLSDHTIEEHHTAFRDSGRRQLVLGAAASHAHGYAVAMRGDASMSLTYSRIMSFKILPEVGYMRVFSET